MNRFTSPIRTVFSGIWTIDGQDANELPYAAKVSIHLRWVFQLAILAEASYRIEYGALSHFFNTAYVLGMMAANGYVWWRIRKSGRVDPRWLLALSAMDVACLTFSMSLSGGIDSRYFPIHYAAVALVAWVFASPYLVISWTTMVAATYVAVCLVAGDGMDLDQQDEKVLFYRLVGIYGVAVSVNMVTRFERMRRLRAVEREGESNRQRIEISQSIHDTTAQSAYMLGLGLEQAVEMAGKSNPGLTDKLGGLSELSRSTMWELRHPIDGGQIFAGGTLSEVLAAHADTFTVITSIPAELVRRGEEPELPTTTRSLLFSIAHNSLTNALRHSSAGSVTILLEFGERDLRMSVSDDGLGLPEDYATRGHGFRNMGADAGRLGGALEVQSNQDGTTVICVVPYIPGEGGR